MTDLLERRPLLELRAVDGEPNCIEGYVAKFNSVTNFKGIREMILPGAFKDTLDKAKRGIIDLLALKDHDSKQVLGRTSNGTLKLTEDDVGLKVQIFPPESTLGRDTLSEVRSGHINGGSFGFITKSSDIDVHAGVRRLKGLDFEEITATGVPIYNDTHLAVARRALEGIENIKDVAEEQILTEDRVRELVSEVLEKRSLEAQVDKVMREIELRPIHRFYKSLGVK